MKNFIIALLVASGVYTPLVAQESNLFLERSFWNPNTSIEEVKKGLNAKHDLSELNANSFDPMVYAILENAPLETLAYVLSHDGNDVNKLTHDGRTYVFWAAYKGNIPLMKLLIEKGGSMNLKDDKGYTVLNFAASTGQKNTEVYDLCISHGASLQKDLTPKGANALLLAAPHDTNFDVLPYFISHGLSLKDKDAEGNGVFAYAATSRKVEILEAFLAKGITPEEMAVIFASKKSRTSKPNLDIYTYLKRLGLALDVKNNAKQNALHLVAENGDLALIQFLLKEGVSINSQDEEGNTPFHSLVKGNTLEIIKAVLPEVKNINVLNKKGVSPLALAIQYQSPAVVEFLLQQGGNVQQLDAAGNSLAAYLIASYSEAKANEFEEKIRILSEHGVRMTEKQANGNTLFHLAVSKNNLNLLNRVAELCSSINEKNQEGLTPLHKAAMEAKDDVLLKHLIKLGADKSVRTEFEETAFDLAQENEVLQDKQISISFLK
ncbi:ankyrin repeat domain-containing protein [Flavobacteriaceae bacterium F08102]|nr:ankyrin repeat domain-containing protein [Flavobacteriaceae bacterium F08102]